MCKWKWRLLKKQQSLLFIKTQDQLMKVVTIVMCNVAKVFEKCINMQLLKYMKKHVFLSPQQSAFRNNFSTQTSLHRVIDDWLEAIEHKCVMYVMI